MIQNENKNKIAAVVVTYNRKEELLKNITAVLNQTLKIDKYYIIDNHGNDGTKEYLIENKVLDNNVIEYVYLNENIGGAGGFYTGVKMAYDNGYNYICLMDDDGRPEDNYMMERLYSVAEMIYKSNNKIMINSIVSGPDHNTLSFGLDHEITTKENAIKKANDKSLIINKINPFNGTFISKELVEIIGFPNKEFFIKGDESDYLLRALGVNAFVATVCNSYYYHPILEKRKIKFLGKEITFSTETPWKEYYRARNYTYIYAKHNKKMQYIKQNIKQIICAICYNKQKVSAVKMIIRGWKDGVKGRLGPTVRP